MCSFPLCCCSSRRIRSSSDIALSAARKVPPFSSYQPSPPPLCHLCGSPRARVPEVITASRSSRRRRAAPAGQCPEKEGWKPRTEAQDKLLSRPVEESTCRRRSKTRRRGRRGGMEVEVGAFVVVKSISRFHRPDLARNRQSVGKKK